MTELSLNETPVRTARNFNINNITLKDIKYIVDLKKFNGTNINGIDENVKLSNTISDYSLKYGVSKELEEQVRKNANSRIKLEIEENAKLEIENKFDKDNLSLVQDIEIISKENAISNIVVKYEGEDTESKYYNNGILRVIANENSKINIVILNLLNTKSENFLSFENEVRENAEINYSIIDFGGKSSITNYYSNLLR